MIIDKPSLPSLHCRDFGTLGEAELLSASLALSSLDHVLVLGEDALNDVALQVGRGGGSARVLVQVAPNNLK